LKKFFVLWSSQAASLFGSSVVGFALGWYVARDVSSEPGSATLFSTVMMMNVLPWVFLGPFVGPLVDRWNRKKIMIYSDLVTMLLTGLLFVLFSTDTIQLWHIYVVLLLRAIGGVFQQPAFNAAVPMIVPDKHLVRVNGLNMSLSGAINLVSPLAGAFLMETLPIYWVLSVDIITALLAIGILLMLRIPQPVRTTLTEKLNIIGDMVQGFRYMASWKALLVLIVIGAIINFVAVPGEMMLPMLVTVRLGGDVLKLGWLGAAFAGGDIAGGLILGAWGGFKRKIATIFLSFIMYSITVFIFGFTTESLFFLGLSMWFMAGVAHAIGNAPVGALFQSVVPKDMQGRVFSLMGSANSAMIPLGLLVFGSIADALGIHMIYHIAGIVIIVTVLTGFYFGNVMDLENQKTAEELIKDNNISA
jgi:DHA3 family macrolide efflux protein-like MFS transporter